MIEILAPKVPWKNFICLYNVYPYLKVRGTLNARSPDSASPIRMRGPLDFKGTNEILAKSYLPSITIIIF